MVPTKISIMLTCDWPIDCKAFLDVYRRSIRTSKLGLGDKRPHWHTLHGLTAFVESSGAIPTARLVLSASVVGEDDHYHHYEHYRLSCL